MKATTGFLLWRVALRFRAGVDRVLTGLDLTHAQYSLLASLYGMSRSGAAPSQRELADHTGLDPIFVSKLARALERAGLLTRDTHPRDPRAVSLALTEHGIATVREAVGLVQQLHRELLAPIGGPDGPRNRELADTLNALLGAAPIPRGNDMTAPVLTGQDIAEAEGAVQGLLELVLAEAGSEVDANEYVLLRVLTLRPSMAPAEAYEFFASQRQLRRSKEELADMLRGLATKGLVTGLDGNGPVAPTERGAELYASLFERVQQATRRLYADFDPDDLGRAKQTLARLADRARTLTRELSA